MDHLEYKDVNNKAFKTYYDKFKKMSKQSLEGDGWFLLVKDFPFKDGENLMFTAGEDIGKWQSKNLVSLYGKMKYIVGRCRKKGPVITLLHFQEGDYVKLATESGLRKELKEYFKGTGVSVRVYKSLKVTEKEPEGAEEEDQESGTTSPSEGQPGSTEVQMPELNTLGEKRNYIMKMAKEIPVKAKENGIEEDPEFKKSWMNLVRFVRGGKVDTALDEVKTILELLASSGGNTVTEQDETAQETSSPGISPGIAKLIKELGIAPPDTRKLDDELERLRNELKTVQQDSLPQAKKSESESENKVEELEKSVSQKEKAVQDLTDQINKNLEQIEKLNKEASQTGLEKIQELAISSIEIAEDKAPKIVEEMELEEEGLKAAYFVYSEAKLQTAYVQNQQARLQQQIEKLENQLSALVA